MRMHKLNYNCWSGGLDITVPSTDSSNIANGHFEYGNQVRVCNANRVDVNNAIVLEESTNSIEDDLGSYTSLTNLTTDKSTKIKGESAEYTHQRNEISEIVPSKLPEGISSDVIVACPEDKFSARDLSTADNTIPDQARVGELQQTYAEVVISHPATIFYFHPFIFIICADNIVHYRSLLCILSF